MLTGHGLLAFETMTLNKGQPQRVGRQQTAGRESDSYADHGDNTKPEQPVDKYGGVTITQAGRYNPLVSAYLCLVLCCLLLHNSFNSAAILWPINSHLRRKRVFQSWLLMIAQLRMMLGYFCMSDCRASLCLPGLARHTSVATF
jgi:hypothetical protein